VFFHLSEIIQKDMMLMLPKTRSLRNVDGYEYCLSVDKVLLWIYIHLSSGRHLVGYLNILRVTHSFYLSYLHRCTCSSPR